MIVFHGGLIIVISEVLGDFAKGRFKEDTEVVMVGGRRL